MVECYGTGENEDAAVLFLPDDSGTSFSLDDLHARLVADEIARGANVTVLMPRFSRQKRRRAEPGEAEEKEETAAAAGSSIPYTEESCLALLTHLKSVMAVSYLGIFSPSSPTPISHALSSMAAAAAAAAPGVLLQCTVLVSPSLDAWHTVDSHTVPTSLLVLDPVAKEQQVKEDPLLIRKTVIVTDSDPESVLRESHKQYNATMKEILYFFKKHLHDWS